MVAPPAIAQKVELCKQAADISSGVFDQRIVHGALAGGVIDRIAPGLRVALPGQADGHGARARVAPRRHGDSGPRRAAASSCGSRCQASTIANSSIAPSRKRSASFPAARSSSMAAATNSRGWRSRASATNRSSRASPAGGCDQSIHRLDTDSSDPPASRSTASDRDTSGLLSRPHFVERSPRGRSQILQLFNRDSSFGFESSSRLVWRAAWQRRCACMNCNRTRPDVSNHRRGNGRASAASARPVRGILL